MRKIKDKEKREKIKKILNLESGGKELEERIREKFSFLRNIQIHSITEINGSVIFEVSGKNEKEHKESYIVFACNNNIEFVIQKQNCKFMERYDIAYMDKLKKLISRLVDELKEPLTEKEINILLSPDYSVDLHFVDRKKHRFQLRAWEKGSKKKTKKSISIVNSTRGDIYEISRELVEIRKKIFK